MNRSNSNIHETCQTEFSYIQHFHEEHIDALKTISITTFISNLITTTAVIYLIIHTKQLKNTSVLIIFYFSISTCSMNLANGLSIIFFYKLHTSCAFELAVMFIYSASLNSAAFMLMLIAYDRYLKVSYLQQYSRKMSRYKVNVLCLIINMLAIGEASLLLTALMHQDRKLLISKVLQIGLNALMLILTVTFYIKAILAMRRHRINSCNRQMLKHVDITVTKLSSLYLISAVVLYSPVLTTDFIIQLSKYGTMMHFSYILGTLIIFTNPTLNAIIFMTLNRPANRFIKTLICKIKINKINTQVSNISHIDLPRASLEQRKNATLTVPGREEHATTT